MTAALPLLSVEGVHAGYDEMVVLEDVGLELQAAGSVAVIGRNGVGKTTLLSAIAGRATLHRGRILFAGTDITAWPANRRARAGIGLVPQQREIFPSLSVRENMEIAVRRGRWTVEAAYELFPRLRERIGNLGNQLSGGEQQMLAIARALVGNPSLLLLDEPSEGLAPVIVEQLVAALGAIRRDGTTAIILVEQKVGMALAFAERTIVMKEGRIAYDGPSRALQDDRARFDQLIGLAAEIPREVIA
ncbi:ABC transporter ATP-binding protein [Arenibaculum sp.]|jgi:branched-chain amino acid transport system ATP-binding protein|uniref:ABC transporter ATP-binding protein n=1 Tax=Arenibaculum sp. TaxID=2865862 RepID=UPI002E0F477E|nr:ABC transporter ATP-binding protein [Arenibaculum sp.]